MDNVNTPTGNGKGYYQPQRVGIPMEASVRELIGAWSSVWSQYHSQRYLVTGPDKTVLTEGAKVFASFAEAEKYFKEAMEWMRADEFWRDKISLKGALTVRNKMVVVKERVAQSRSKDGQTLTKLQAEMREIDPVAFDRLYSASVNTER